jgi:hypothetical protein
MQIIASRYLPFTMLVPSTAPRNPPQLRENVEEAVPVLVQPIKGQMFCRHSEFEIRI